MPIDRRPFELRQSGVWNGTRAGTQAALVAGCARHVRPGGALVCGVQLDRGYDLATYDQQCAHAGLGLTQRWATWDRESFQPDGSYAVSVHSPRADQPTGEDRIATL